MHNIRQLYRKHFGRAVVYTLLSLFLCMAGAGKAAAAVDFTYKPQVKVISTNYTNSGTEEFSNLLINQYSENDGKGTQQSRWCTIELKLSFDNSFSYYGHKISVRGLWQDNSGAPITKYVSLDNTIGGYVRPTNLKVRSYDSSRMRLSWGIQDYNGLASKEGSWKIYKCENGKRERIGVMEYNDNFFNFNIQKKKYNCSATYDVTFKPRQFTASDTICGLTTSVAATGHKLNADDVCQYCNHSFFRYTTSDGKIVETIKNQEQFGANIVAHSVVDGKCVIEFDAPITKIPANAFYYKNSLTGSLVIPNSVTEIGNYAFGYCTGFNGTLTLSNKLETIGSNAFSNCSSLTGDLVIPNSVTEIGEKAFYNCTGFNGTLTLSNKLETIGELAFNGCTGFTGSLKLPSSLTDIGNGAFVICKSFTSLELSNALSVIPRSAFRGCEGLSGSLVIPDGVKEIGASAFSGCTGFDGTLTLSNKLETIGVLAFGGCTGFTGSLTLPSSVTTIGESAFIRCQSFTKLELPNTLSVIPTQAFMRCRSLSGELVIPASVTEIGNHAFYDCQNLNAVTGQVTLPKSLKKIGYYVFSNTNNIKTVNFQSLPESISGILGNNKKAVSLSDDSYISDKASGTVDEISYTRQMSNNWGTLVLPYSLTLTGEESYRLYTIDKIDGNELVLSRIEGTVAAGTPCVVKRNDSEADLIFGANDATLNMTIDRKTVGDMTFHGTYTTEEVNSGYVISKDCFWNVDELNSKTVVKGVKVSPFRAWLDGNAASGPARLAMRIDGSTTGINTPDALDVLNDAEAEYYDLSGKRLHEPQKGVNIVRMKSGKTKKIIIK